MGQRTQSSDRAGHLHSAQLSRESTAPGNKGLPQDLLGPLTGGLEHMGWPQRTRSLKGNFPRGPLSTQSAPQGGEAHAGADSPAPPPGGPLAAPRTAHPCPSTAQARLGSGHRSGDERGAAGAAGAVTRGLGPARTPVRRRGAGAGRALCAGAPGPLSGPPPAASSAGEGAPRPRRGQDTCGGPAAGVRSGPAASPALCSPPPPSRPPRPPPPTPRPPGPGRPPAPRRAPPAQQL